MANTIAQQRPSLFGTSLGLLTRRSVAEKPQQSEQTHAPVDKRKAYADIAHSCEGDLLRAARRLCSNEDWAQDLVQDALVRGYEAFLEGRFQTGTNAKAWLVRILTNSFINDYRRKKKWEAPLDVDTLTCSGEVGPVSLRASENDQPESALLTSTLDEPLERALAGLSEELRICVVLVDIEGMEYAEMARALEIPIGTVRSRLSRARLLLHSQLLGYAENIRRV